MKNYGVQKQLFWAQGLVGRSGLAEELRRRISRMDQRIVGLLDRGDDGECSDLLLLALQREPFVYLFILRDLSSTMHPLLRNGEVSSNARIESIAQLRRQGGLVRDTTPQQSPWGYLSGIGDSHWVGQPSTFLYRSLRWHQGKRWRECTRYFSGKCFRWTSWRLIFPRAPPNL